MNDRLPANLNLKCKKMQDFPKNDFRPLLLTGVSYEGNFNTAELYFESSFQEYPTFYSFFTFGGRWPGGQVAGEIAP